MSGLSTKVVKQSTDCGLHGAWSISNSIRVFGSEEDSTLAGT